MVGQQIQLIATVKDASGAVLTGRPVTWASSNTAVATVDMTGLVRGLALGQATITATSDGKNATATVTTTTGLLFATVSAGGRHTCGVTSAGVAYCWGDNSSGQLGNGTVNNSATPMLVSGGLSFATVTAGDDHTCGVTSAGVAYCWGDNGAGQLGNGTMNNSATPVPVSGGHSFVTVSAGGRHSCGVSGSDLPNPPQLLGIVFCWGDNSSGQLGNGTFIDSAIPVAVASGVGWSGSLSAGRNHTCAVAIEGGFAGVQVPYCWGDNSSGQLGNGTTINSAVPARVLNGPDVQVSAGTSYSCGSVYPSPASCWGNNGAGQLGNGTMANSSAPVNISGGLSFGSVSTGAIHACGLVNSTATGTAFSVAFCWGDNSFGQLGNGTTTESATPIAVAGGLNFATLSAGGRHTCGVTSNLPSSPTVAGAVYCWGDNSFGQLGNSWTTTSNVPVNVAAQL